MADMEKFEKRKRIRKKDTFKRKRNDGKETHSRSQRKLQGLTFDCFVRTQQGVKWNLKNYEALVLYLEQI